MKTSIKKNKAKSFYAAHLTRIVVLYDTQRDYYLINMYNLTWNQDEAGFKQARKKRGQHRETSHIPLFHVIK